VAIIAMIAYWLVREMKKKDTLPPSDEPLDILKRRYAKSELTKEQFQDMKKTSKGSRHCTNRQKRSRERQQYDVWVNRDAWDRASPS
jgi:hypothetical protein